MYVVGILIIPIGTNLFKRHLLYFLDCLKIGLFLKYLVSVKLMFSNYSNLELFKSLAKEDKNKSVKVIIFLLHRTDLSD